MGAVNATLVDNVKINAETFVTGQEPLSFDAAILAADVVAIGAGAQAIAGVAFTASKLQFLYMVSDQDITLTFTLGTGTLVVALVAGVPWRWSNTYAANIPNPFAYNSLSCTAANASGVAANLSIRGGVVA